MPQPCIDRSNCKYRCETGVVSQGVRSILYDTYKTVNVFQEITDVTRISCYEDRRMSMRKRPSTFSNNVILAPLQKTGVAENDVVV